MSKLVTVKNLMQLMVLHTKETILDAKSMEKVNKRGETVLSTLVIGKKTTCKDRVYTHGKTVEFMMGRGLKAKCTEKDLEYGQTGSVMMVNTAMD